ncbi:MAG: metal-dependent hydrolase [archaeon]|nr:metal-dependent hydrolase [archaeon]
MSHGAFGLFLYGLIAGLFDVFSIQHLTLAALCAILPDIDHPRSALGILFFPVSRWINRKYGHRTVTHSLKFLGAVSLAATPLIFLDWMLWLAVPLGIFAHLMSDGMTVSGVPLLYPDPRPFYFLPEWMLIKTGTSSEILFFGAFMLLAVAVSGVSYMGGGLSLLSKLLPSYGTIQREYIRGYDGAGVRKLCYIEAHYIPTEEDIEGLCTGTDGMNLILRTDRSYYLLNDRNTGEINLKAREKVNVTITDHYFEREPLETIFDSAPGGDMVIVSGSLKGKFYALEPVKHPEVLELWHSGEKMELNHVVLSDIKGITGYIEYGELNYKVIKYFKYKL